MTDARMIRIPKITTHRDFAPCPEAPTAKPMPSRTRYGPVVSGRNEAATITCETQAELSWVDARPRVRRRSQELASRGRVPGRRVRGARLVPRRAARQARSRRGAGGRREDRA